MSLIVNEPTNPGHHDMKRLLELIQRFQISAGIVINKADLNQTICSQLITLADQKHISLLDQIPFDETVINALFDEKIITDFPDSPAHREIVHIFENICHLFEQEGKKQ